MQVKMKEMEATEEILKLRIEELEAEIHSYEALENPSAVDHHGSLYADLCKFNFKRRN